MFCASASHACNLWSILPLYSSARKILAYELTKEEVEQGLEYPNAIFPMIDTSCSETGYVLGKSFVLPGVLFSYSFCKKLCWVFFPSFRGTGFQLWLTLGCWDWWTLMYSEIVAALWEA